MTDWVKTLIRTKIEAVITQREGMIAENKTREHRGEALAYTEDAFAVLVSDLAAIEEQIRNSY